MPLAWVFYHHVLDHDVTQTTIIMLKQAVNGIFNALVASLILIYLPIHRWFNRPQGISSLSLQQTLFNLLVEQLGRTIEARSIQSQTTFRIELPTTC